MRIELGMGLAINAMSYSVEKTKTGKANRVQEVDHARSSRFMNYPGCGKWLRGEFREVVKAILDDGFGEL
jgi:hypothetical protein